MTRIFLVEEIVIVKQQNKNKIYKKKQNKTKQRIKTEQEGGMQGSKKKENK